MKASGFYPVFLAVCTVACLQAADLGGPLLGYVAELSGHAVRPIYGIPGSATTGASVDLGSDVTRVQVSPSHEYAILCGGGVRIAWLRETGAPVISDALLPAEFTPSVIAFSPGGANAVLYDAGSHDTWMITVRGSDAPAVRPIDVSMIAGIIRSLAVADGDDPSISGLAAADPTSVFVLGTSGNFRWLTDFSRVAAVAFLAGSRDLAIADAGRGQVLVARDPLSGGDPQLLAQLTEGAAPVLLASTEDGGKVSVLDGGTSKIWTITTSTGEIATLNCGCVPTVLQPLRGKAVFQLTEAPDQPLWILDEESTDPRIMFVPAVPGAPAPAVAAEAQP